SSSTEAYFGATPATQDLVAPYPASSDLENFLTTTAPPGTAGPVSVILTDANNNPVFLVDAFTYGPHILRLEPNTVGSTQDVISIIGYGLGFNLGDAQVAVNGAPTVPKGLSPPSGLGYPEQNLIVGGVSNSSPGWADVTLTTSNGSHTLTRGL